MGSLSEHERIGLDDIFISLSKKQGHYEKLQHRGQRVIDGLHQLAKKGVPLSLRYIKSKKFMFSQRNKMYKSKLFSHIIPKNRGSK